MSEISRLRWLCRRGMKELDMAMLSYLNNFYEQASPAHQSAFKNLLEMQEPELYGLITNKSVAEDESTKEVIQLIRENVTPIP